MGSAFQINKILKFFFSEKLILALILFVGLYVRLYKIDSPIADWHSWRQADTAAVTRNFVKEGFNPFYPRYDDMSGVSENPYPNPGRFRFVEFPIYNIAVYPLYLFFGINDEYHRLVSVIFSLGSTILVYLITKKYIDTKTALIAALVFSLLPFNVFFSRTTLPEPTFVFFALGMFYFVDKWLNIQTKINKFVTNIITTIFAYLFTTVAFLIKPWAIFFALPLLYAIYKQYLLLRNEQVLASSSQTWLRNKKENRVIIPFRKLWRYILFVVLALSPFILWRLWILQHPEGIPAFGWLMNGDGIRYRPAFWWWIVSERIGGEILGATGIVLLVIGLLKKPNNGNFLLHIWFLTTVLYFIVFATGNVRHNYYQILFVPVASIFTARGFIVLLEGVEDFIPRIWTIPLAVLLLVLTFYFSWMHIKGFYQINNPAIIEAGKKADQILPKEAVVVAPYNGDTAFLYQINRPGWPVVAFPLRELVTYYGVTHYVSTTKDAKTKWAMKYFKVLVDDPNFVILDITKFNNNWDAIEPEP